MQVEAFLFAEKVTTDRLDAVTLHNIIWDIGCVPASTRIWMYVALSFPREECDERKHLEVRILNPEGELVGGFEVKKDKVDVFAVDGRGYAMISMEFSFLVSEPGMYPAELWMNGALCHERGLGVLPKRQPLATEQA